MSMMPFSTQERHVLKQMHSLVGSLDHWRSRCAALEHALAYHPTGPRRDLLIRDLFEAQRREAAATLDLRDGAAYVAGLVAPIAQDAAR